MLEEELEEVGAWAQGQTRAGLCRDRWRKGLDVSKTFNWDEDRLDLSKTDDIQ